MTSNSTFRLTTQREGQTSPNEKPIRIFADNIAPPSLINYATIASGHRNQMRLWTDDCLFVISKHFLSLSIC